MTKYPISPPSQSHKWWEGEPIDEKEAYKRFENVPIPKKNAKYSFETLKVGQSDFVPNGNHKSIRNCCSQFVNKGYKYTIRKMEVNGVTGIMVWRIK